MTPKNPPTTAFPAPRRTGPALSPIRRAGRAGRVGGPLAGIVVLALLLGGCTTLLPSAKDEVVSNWQSYDDAVASLATVEPFRATRQDVHAQGLDPRLNPAIKILHFADVLQRFAAATLIKPEDVDRGIRDCLHAGQQCTGYAIAVRKVQRNRVGNFWLDSLNFRRETETRGWSVEVLLVFVDDRLVYELVGGEPTIRIDELHRNPLGPLQSWGDESMRMMR
jgi:hypothetical protein